jgi:hypothetical protein
MCWRTMHLWVVYYRANCNNYIVKTLWLACVYKRQWTYVKYGLVQASEVTRKSPETCVWICCRSRRSSPSNRCYRSRSRDRGKSSSSSSGGSSRRSSYEKKPSKLTSESWYWELLCSHSILISEILCWAGLLGVCLRHIIQGVSLTIDPKVFLITFKVIDII